MIQSWCSKKHLLPKFSYITITWQIPKICHNDSVCVWGHAQNKVTLSKLTWSSPSASRTHLSLSLPQADQSSSSPQTHLLPQTNFSPTERKTKQNKINCGRQLVVSAGTWCQMPSSAKVPGLNSPDAWHSNPIHRLRTNPATRRDDLSRSLWVN